MGNLATGAFTNTDVSDTVPSSTSTGGAYKFAFSAANVVKAGNETTPLSTSYYPRIHI
jgi:hypothetical protein